MKEAMFYEKLGEMKVQCALCAHSCIIHQGRRGICGVRENREGILYSLVYGKLIAANVDPIEKKPLFHFLPGTASFSVATVGCNFKCKHCQNYDIAHCTKESKGIPGDDATPEQVVKAAERAGCRSISYTYTEPTVFYEFAFDCARIAHERGIKNVFVSNGYTSLEAVKTIAPVLDGINIDLKGDDEFYKKISGARLQPVLNTIQLMKELGVWVEVTTLIIPSYNDSEKTLGDIIEFIKSVDPGIPWHVSQFYPTYKLLDQPRTPVATLKRAREMGIQRGLKYVYEGNVPGEGSESTSCPGCGELLVERHGYQITGNTIGEGECPHCSLAIEGVWR
ncbi:MAG: AmmeMemoRadiSam system radical SAM enzyme [Nitrospiraceae bacterium]|nr:MAG: AmmeMemoRadiSam system radical SAM enzyme [Nitrospiraceae bacterium]